MSLGIRKDKRALSTLVLDFEARPTAWISGDFVGKSITAAGWTWDGETADSVVLTRAMLSTKPIMSAVMEQMEKADIVIGHYLRGYDMLVLNTELERNGMEPLDHIITLDTKLDRLSTMGMSQSLANLLDRYDLSREKKAVSEPMWEEHNLWQTPRSVEWVRERVEMDVLATYELYKVLVEKGRILGPQMWSATKQAPRYRA